VVVCVSEPAVAVMVMVEVCGCVFLPELPHPVATADAASRHRKTKSIPLREPRLRKRRNPKMTAAGRTSAHVLPPNRKRGVNAEDWAAVAIVNVVLAALPLGVTVEGLKLQVAPVGSPEQAKLTCWLNPPAGVTVTVVVADWPAVTVPEFGESPMLKVDVAALTVTVTAAEVEPE
jgi:hypothetical protein